MAKPKLTKLETQILDAVAERMIAKGVKTQANDTPTKVQIRAAFQSPRFAKYRFPIYVQRFWNEILAGMIREVQSKGGKAATFISWWENRNV